MSSDFHAVNIVDCENYNGTGLIATRAIKKDEVIFREFPLVSSQFSWNRKYGYLACDNCMAPLESTQEYVRRLCQQSDLTLPYLDQELPPLPLDSTSVLPSSTAFDACSFCGIRYCSSKCRKEAWQTYHEVLCMADQVDNPDHPLNKLEEAWRSIHYPPETETIMIPVRMIAMLKQASERDRPILKNKFESFCQSSPKEIDLLMLAIFGEDFVAKIENVRKFVIAALYDDSIASYFTYDGLSGLLAIVKRNAERIVTNPLKMWIKRTELLKLDQLEQESLTGFIKVLHSKMKDTVGQFVNIEGMGLYPIESKINHSCVICAEEYFSGASACLSFIALRDIEAGDPIENSYTTDTDLVRPRQFRQKWLLKNYLFVCECPRCLREMDKPDVTSDVEENLTIDKRSVDII